MVLTTKGRRSRILLHLPYHYLLFIRQILQRYKTLSVGGVSKISTISQTLKEGNLNFFIHSCFTEFDPSYNEVVFNYLGTEKEEKKFMEELDAVLAKLKFRFLKKLAGYMYQYLTQPAMLSKLNLPQHN